VIQADPSKVKPFLFLQLIYFFWAAGRHANTKIKKVQPNKHFGAEDVQQLTSLLLSGSLQAFHMHSSNQIVPMLGSTDRAESSGFADQTAKTS
jgi:hypothetical protein